MEPSCPQRELCFSHHPRMINQQKPILQNWNTRFQSCNGEGPAAILPIGFQVHSYGTRNILHIVRPQNKHISQGNIQSVFTHNTSDTKQVCFSLTAITPPVIQTPTGCSTIPFNSDTDSPELMQTLYKRVSVKGLVSKDCNHFRHYSQLLELLYF